MIPFPIDVKKDTLCDVIDRWAEVQPDAPAVLTDGKEPLTYGALSTQIQEMRKSIRASGLGPSDRIGILHSGGAEMLSALLGALSGAVVVPLNPNFRTDEIKVHLENTGVTALLIEDGLDSPAEEEAKRQGIMCLRIENTDPSTSGGISLVGELTTQKCGDMASHANDLAFVLSTSGTTSKCKTFALRWHQVLTHCQSNTLDFQLGPQDRFFSFRPLYYTGPLISVMSALYSGGAVLIRAQFEADKILQDLISYRITWLHCGPTFLYDIHERAHNSQTFAAQSSLKFIRTGSSRSDPNILDELELLLGVPVLETYSSSETGPITSNPLPPNLNKRGTVGFVRMSDVAILGSDGSIQEAGNAGEIIVRGPRVIEGYDNDPNANSETFVDGWFRTGDEGFFDADGYLTLTGRSKELINRGGEKVSPTEVDTVLMQHPSVAEAATFPFSHPTLGQEVAAAIVFHKGEQTSESDLIDYLFERLTHFKIPKKIIFSESIPKSEDGKVKRQELAAIFGVGVKEGPS